MGEIVVVTSPGKAPVPPETSKQPVVTHVLASGLYHYSPRSAKSKIPITSATASPNTAFFFLVSATDYYPLDCKEIQQVHPKGNQSWIFIGSIDTEDETPIFWPPDAKSWLILKDPDAGKD